MVWNIFCFPIYWVSNHPNWLSYFSEGWPNHQPDRIALIHDVKSPNSVVLSFRVIFHTSRCAFSPTGDFYLRDIKRPFSDSCLIWGNVNLIAGIHLLTASELWFHIPYQTCGSHLELRIGFPSHMKVWMLTVLEQISKYPLIFQHSHGTCPFINYVPMKKKLIFNMLLLNDIKSPQRPSGQQLWCNLRWCFEKLCFSFFVIHSTLDSFGMCLINANWDVEKPACVDHFPNEKPCLLSASNCE